MSNIFDLFNRISTGSPTPRGPIEWLIVGLGNPGKKYELTRHNAGFLAIDYIAERAGVRIDRARFHALTAEATLGGHSVLLMKPQTMMNASGEAVEEAAAFYKLETDHIIMLTDDINLDVGRMRLRFSGSDGGQKGLRSTIGMLGSDQFPRLRFGVGKKPYPDMDLADWVLSRFTDGEIETIRGLYPRAYEGLLLVLDGQRDAAVMACNSAK